MICAAHNASHLARRLRASRTWVPFLAPLLVLTLLVCHGSLDGTHRVMLEPALPAETLADAAEAGTFASHLVEHSVGHSLGHSAENDFAPPVDIAAALFLVFLGSALGALLWPSRRRGAPPGAAPPAFARAHPLVARPPAPPLLQVFRL